MHDITGEIRRRGGEKRAWRACAPIDAASIRDEAALARDVAALARDQQMAARDERDSGFDDARAIAGPEVVVRAASTRRRAVERRAQAAEDRATAAVERAAAAHERVVAALERDAARAERAELLRQLAAAESGALTAARSRGAGMGDLEREIARCARQNSTVVVAAVGVVGATIFEGGHAERDALLRRVAAVIGSQLRAYDLLIPHGDDVLLCVMSEITLAHARKRVRDIAALLTAAGNAVIASGTDPDAIRSGFAVLQAGDSATALIARAMHDLTAD